METGLPLFHLISGSLSHCPFLHSELTCLPLCKTLPDLPRQNYPFTSAPLSSPTRYHIHVLCVSASRATTCQTPCYINSLQAQTTHFTDKGAEAQRIKLTCPKFIQLGSGWSGFEPGQQVPAFPFCAHDPRAAECFAHKAEG